MKTKMEPKNWERIENIIHPERKKVLNEILSELIAENFSTLIPNNKNQMFYEGKIKGLEKAIKIVKSKIYEDKKAGNGISRCIALTVKHTSHTETILINSAGHTFTFNPEKHEGLDDFIGSGD